MAIGASTWVSATTHFSAQKMFYVSGCIIGIEGQPRWQSPLLTVRMYLSIVTCPGFCMLLLIALSTALDLLAAPARRQHFECRSAARRSHSSILLLRSWPTSKLTVRSICAPRKMRATEACLRQRWGSGRASCVKDISFLVLNSTMAASKSGMKCPASGANKKCKAWCFHRAFPCSFSFSFLNMG